MLCVCVSRRRRSCRPGGRRRTIYGLNELCGNRTRGGKNIYRDKSGAESPGIYPRRMVCVEIMCEKPWVFGIKLEKDDFGNFPSSPSDKGSHSLSLYLSFSHTQLNINNNNKTPLHSLSLSVLNQEILTLYITHSLSLSRYAQLTPRSSTTLLLFGNFLPTEKKTLERYQIYNI